MIIIVLSIFIVGFLFAGIFKEDLNLDMDRHGGCIVILGIILGLLISLLF